MRTFLLLLFITNLMYGQTNSEIKYYKDKYGRTEVSNGPYMLKITKVNDSVTNKVFLKVKNGQKLWSESYVNDRPFGIWARYNKKGEIEWSRDYNFNLKYGEYIPEGSFKFKELGIDGKQEPNTKKILHHIRKNFIYPEFAQENDIQGRVTLQFTIDEEGNVGNVSILEGVHISLDTECFSIMNSLKKLEPYEKDGEKVMVHYTVPISFKMV